jgi:transposase-like protein
VAALGALLAPLVAGLTATREHLFAWVQGCGVAALQAVFQSEAEAIAGPKGKHQAERTHHRWGATARELTLGGRRLSVPCPRVRRRDGGEVTLPSVAAWRTRDPLTVRVVEHLLLGVSTRGYAASLPAAPAAGRSRGTSRSAVSRALRARTQAAVAAQAEQRLEGLEVVALFVDGLVVAKQSVIVALGVTRAGTKVPLGLRVGSTENAVLCTDLVQDLLHRGLALDSQVLCVIDGGKGIHKALTDVLGDRAVIQRCQLHKLRNVLALVPKARQVYVRAHLRRAYRAGTADQARRQLKTLATWLEANGHPTAAASVREGLEEMLTVLKLDLPAGMRRFFVTTNCIENLMSGLRRVTRNVKRWRGGAMIERWVALGLRQAQARFHRIKGHRDLTAVGAALRPAERIA